MLESQAIIDTSLNLDNQDNNELSILISESGLSFLVLDVQKQKIVAWKRYAFEPNLDVQERCFYLSKYFKKETLCAAKYHKVKVLYALSESVLIPKVFYTKDKEQALFEFNLKLNKNESIYRNSIENIEAEKLFAVPDCVYYVLQKQFPQFHLLHHTSPILVNRQDAKEDNTVYTYWSASFFSVSVFKQGKLILDNAFKYQTQEDALYYLLNLLTKIDLDPKMQKIVCYLDIPKDSGLIQFLSEFLGNLQYPEYPQEYIYHHQITSDFTSYLTAQITSFKCE